jgi:hypothetical protein
MQKLHDNINNIRGQSGTEGRSEEGRGREQRDVLREQRDVLALLL